jgi:hypothetical protein
MAGPGWYPDPWGRSAWRWWDGVRWSGWISPPEHINPAIVRQIVENPEPLSAPPPEAPYRERLVGGGPAGVTEVDMHVPPFDTTPAVSPPQSEGT